MNSPPLPIEVVGLILDADDRLLLKDVVRASRVSHSWRRAARLHPLYSQDIFLYSDHLARGHLLFFLDRLNANPRGILHLNIGISDRDFAGNDGVKRDVRTMLLPALSAALPRVVTLLLHCAEELIPDILEALRRGKAPRLEVFKFYAPGDPRDEELEELPLDVFQGHAPLLGVLQIDACNFPEDGVVPALASVTKLIRVVSDDEAADELHPERFFENCPALEELFLNGDTHALTRADWDACPPPAETTLRRLTVVIVDTDQCTEAAVRALAHAGTQAITVDTSDVNDDTIDFMLGALDSAALHLAVTGHEDKLDVAVRDARERCRTFTHSAGDMGAIYLDPEEPLLPHFARIAPRLERISVSDYAYAWNHLLALFPDADGTARVESLVLYLSRTPFPKYKPKPARKLALPALAELELAADDEDEDIAVSADKVLGFVQRMLDVPAGRKLKLVLLDGVRLTGDVNILANQFVYSQ